MDEILDEELRIISENGEEVSEIPGNEFNQSLEGAHGSNKQDVVDKDYAGVTNDPEDIEDEILNQEGIQE